jgi:hypothetical protein
MQTDANGNVLPSLECIPEQTGSAVVAKFSALSTPKKVAVGAIAATGIWAAVRYAMGKAINPFTRGF